MYSYSRIPDKWRTSILILLFKRGDKLDPSKGINLLIMTLKLTTKTIAMLLNDLLAWEDEQQGFLQRFNFCSLTNSGKFPRI